MNKPKIGFTCGAFDILHAGHILMLKEAKEQCDYLIVGLQTDPTIDRPDTKNKPIQTVDERRIQLEGCKYIDKIFIYKTEMELIDLLTFINPNIRILGADWKGKEFTGKNLKIKCYFNSRNHNYSSTNLRKRIYEAEKLKEEK
jgi:glycerol-3-phosphate cytidylyltransferase